MADTDDYAAAFKEVARVVQPDVDPVLTKGNGTAPDATKELDSIILDAKVASTWTSGATAAYGSLWMPTTRNGRIYRVTIGGTLGTTEPTSWPTYDYGSVVSGSVTLEDAGSQLPNIYDIRRACYLAWLLKAAKAQDRVNYSADGRSFNEHQTPEFCVKQADRYKTVGVG